MKNFKINQTEEIDFNFAKSIVKNTLNEYEFKLLNESTKDDNVDFETVQNRKYYLTKIKRRGSFFQKNSPIEEKTSNGIFRLTMTWDFKHPNNFALNQNNIEKNWIVAL